MLTPHDFADGSRPLVWLDFDAYAHQVFAGGTDAWLKTPASRIGALERAQSIVASDVVVLDLAAPFLAGGAATSTLFREKGACAYLRELLDAAGHRLARKASLVLSLPSPRDLLVATGFPAQESPSFEACDDIALAASDLLRDLSEKPVTWLCLSFSDRALVRQDELEAIQPLVAVAGHYGWGIALAFPGATTSGRAYSGALKADAFLYPDAEGGTGDPAVLTGLPQSWWTGHEEETPARFCGAVPTHVAPEQLLDRLVAFRPGSAVKGGDAA